MSFVPSERAIVVICPKCGRDDTMYCDPSMMLMSNPPQYRVWCTNHLECDLTGYIYADKAVFKDTLDPSLVGSRTIEALQKEIAALKERIEKLEQR